MGDVIIRPDTVKVYISPLGFHRYASEFLKAAKDSTVKENFSPVPYYLYCRSIELALKSYLLARGLPKKKLKKRNLEHDLGKLLRKAQHLDLSDVVEVTSQHRQELAKANDYYASKGFEYFDVANTMIGYSNIRALSALKDFASLLVTKLEPICREAADLPT